MSFLRGALITEAIAWAGERRFPTLLALTAAVFLLDVLTPDALPFLDEVVLGLFTAVLAVWKRRGEDPQPPPES
jgi:hypothetical protein